MESNTHTIFTYAAGQKCHQLLNVTLPDYKKTSMFFLTLSSHLKGLKSRLGITARGDSKTKYVPPFIQNRMLLPFQFRRIPRNTLETI